MNARTAIDLTRHAWTQTHGDITAYGTWWLASNSGPKPCMVLIPTYSQTWEKATPCVVMLENAWLWSDIGDPAAAAREAFEFAAALGLNINQSRTDEDSQ